MCSKAAVAETEASRVRAEIAEDCEIVGVTALRQPVCRDSDDDIILATPIAARADLIVTGDKDLLVLTEFQQIPIVTPAECLARLTAERS